MADVTACVGEYRLCCQPGVSLMKIGIQTVWRAVCCRTDSNIRCSNAENKQTDLVLCRKVPLGVSGPLNSLNKRP
ncbi:hypothetical protein Q8A67_023588 [Cirrhinus molitorella]|uniref:Uncharacterized protein n=1 Tax=Cirrhinus molitorella TaxID=172907 RepID=A0AA88P063_9TELE|nr:hypothetical protein Q8A67_023588 [Cirrhinus molitorella]